MGIQARHLVLWMLLLIATPAWADADAVVGHWRLTDPGLGEDGHVELQLDPDGRFRLVLQASLDESLLSGSSLSGAGEPGVLIDSGPLPLPLAVGVDAGGTWTADGEQLRMEVADMEMSLGLPAPHGELLYLRYSRGVAVELTARLRIGPELMSILNGAGGPDAPVPVTLDSLDVSLHAAAAWPADPAGAVPALQAFELLINGVDLPTLVAANEELVAGVVEGGVTRMGTDLGLDPREMDQMQGTVMRALQEELDQAALEQVVAAALAGLGEAETLDVELQGGLSSPYSVDGDVLTLDAGGQGAAQWVRVAGQRALAHATWGELKDRVR